MRSVFLEGIQSEQSARAGLDAEFPGQTDSTKIVFDPGGSDAIGWLYFGESEDPADQLGPYLIQADYSGRPWDFDAKTVVLKALRLVV